VNDISTLPGTENLRQYDILIISHTLEAAILPYRFVILMTFIVYYGSCYLVFTSWIIDWHSIAVNTKDNFKNYFPWLAEWFNWQSICLLSARVQTPYFQKKKNRKNHFLILCYRMPDSCSLLLTRVLLSLVRTKQDN
jgi:hypothetical protein